MACRIKNRSAHPVMLDLRGGATLTVAPGATSPALREEMLYGNPYVEEWRARGLIEWQDVPLADVLAAERRGPARPGGAQAAEAPALQAVKGVGVALVRALAKEGIRSVAELASADEERIAGLAGVGARRARAIQASARELARP